nr:MAG TPA: hypothetical protein [Caudoviricetes sp.]
MKLSIFGAKNPDEFFAGFQCPYIFIIAFLGYLFEKTTGFCVKYP